MAKEKTAPEGETSDVKKAEAQPLELDKREEALNAKEEALRAKEEDLNKREEALNAKEEALRAKEEDLNKREEALNAKEEDLKSKTQESTKSKSVPGIEFEFRKEKYKFTDDAPKSIRFGGLAYTQKEIAEDEDVLVELIGGNSVLIEKL